MNRMIQILAAAGAGLCGFLWGEFDGMLYALITFMVLDYLSGVLVAITQKELSSKVGFKGIAKKACILMLVAVGHLVDEHVLGGAAKAACRSMVAGFYAANEGISVLENASALGIPLPKKLVVVLKQLKENSDKEDKEE